MLYFFESFRFSSTVLVKNVHFSISSLVTFVRVLNYSLHETAVILLIILSESLKHSVNLTRSTVGRSKEAFNTTS